MLSAAAIALLLVPTGLCTAGTFPELFLQQVVHQELFSSLIFNIIACDDSVAGGVVSGLSAGHRGLCAAHPDTQPLQHWVDGDTPQVFLLDTTCPGAMHILRQAEKLNLFRRAFSWILVDLEMGNITETEDVWASLRQLYIPVDSQVVLASTEPGGGGAVRLTGVYKIWAAGELLQERVGVWSTGRGLQLGQPRAVAARRADLQGLPLHTAVVFQYADSLNHLDDLVDNHHDSITKVCVEVMRNAMDSINASLQLVLEEAWGGRQPNGTWTGMVGSVQAGRSHVVATALFVTKERMEVLEYLTQGVKTSGKFIFLSPPLSYSSNIFALPFSSAVWAASLGTMLLCAALLYGAVRVEMRDSGRPGRDRGDSSLQPAWSDVLMLHIAAICMQGSTVEPKQPSGRIVTIFLFFSVMFLYVSYSACIVALLQSSDLSIRSLSDLLSSPLAVGADDIVYSQHYFKTASDPVRKAIYDRKVAPKGRKPNFFPKEEGIARVRRGLFAFHVEKSPGYQLVQKTFTEDEKCGLQELKPSFFPSANPWFAIRRRSPYTEALKIALAKVMERGLSSRQIRRYYTKKPVCSGRGSNFVSVGLVDCYHAFLWLAYGMALASTALLIETCSKKRFPHLGAVKLQHADKWSDSIPRAPSSAECPPAHTSCPRIPAPE